MRVHLLNSSLAAVFLCLLSLTGLSQNIGTPYTLGDITYTYIQRGPDTLKARPDQIVSFEFELFIALSGRDSLLQSSRAIGFPADLPPRQAPAIGDLLSVVAVGDSIEALLPPTRFSQQNLPPEAKMKLKIKALKFYTKPELDIEMERRDKIYQQRLLAKEEEVKISDEATFKKLLSSHPKAQRTPEGLYYTIDSEGNGSKPLPGDTVTVHYEGRFLSNGQKFHASYDQGQPLTMPIGVGRLIKGWDIGIPLMNAGSKATLYIPSHLGYGIQGNNGIPGFSALIFRLELLEVRPLKR